MFSGPQEEKDGLFDTIQRNKSHYQKRAYQCIKMLVNLFSHSPVAHKLLQTMPDAKKKWIAAVNWLNEELDRRTTFQQAINQYAYNWSPPAQSNETSNGYYLERSNSAKLTLSKAIELSPAEEKEETDDQEMSDDVERLSSESPPNSVKTLFAVADSYLLHTPSSEPLCAANTTQSTTATTTAVSTSSITSSNSENSIPNASDKKMADSVPNKDKLKAFSEFIKSTRWD